MKNLKRILAIALIAVMAFAICGCHKKNETAIKVGDIKYTAAYYMCALVNADMSARQKIDTTDASVDVYSQKIEDKPYETYVKDEAIRIIKENAAYKIKCDEAKLSLSKEQEQELANYVEAMWTSYGYSELFEDNGVSKNTYMSFMRATYYKDIYFDYLYGKDGKNAVTDDEISAFKNDNYCLADVLAVDLSTKETDEEKQTLSMQMEAFLTDLQSGTKTFNQIYEEYNQITADQKQESYSRVLGSDKTDYVDDNFDKIKAMAADEIQLLKNEDETKLTLVVKKDLASDAEINEQLNDVILHNLKDEEFEKSINDFIKTLKFEEIKKSTKQFKIKNIKYPENEQQ